MSRNTADAVLELFPQVVRALRAIEWTTEDVNNAHGRLFCPECGRHSFDCPCDDCPGEVVVAPNGGHDDECTIGSLLCHPVVHAIPDEPAPDEVPAAEVATTGAEPALATVPVDFETGAGHPAHLKIEPHPEFFAEHGLYNVTLLTTLCLTHAEVGALADFLADVSADDLAGEVNGWLDENPAKCHKCGKPEGDEGWIGLCDDCSDED